MVCPFCKKESSQLVEIQLLFFKPKLCKACMEAWFLLLQGGRQTLQNLRRSK